MPMVDLSSTLVRRAEALHGWRTCQGSVSMHVSLSVTTTTEDERGTPKPDLTKCFLRKLSTNLDDVNSKSLH